MTIIGTGLNRRTLLAGTAITAGSLAMPAIVRAQGAPIRLATLLPLTGAGGPYGPVMGRAVKPWWMK